MEYTKIKEFWEAECNKRLVTSTNPNWILRFEEVGPFKEDLDNADGILEVGIGGGNMLRALIKKYDNVHGMDISEKILENKPESVTGWVLGSIRSPIATVAFAHLVVQHCPPGLLSHTLGQIKEALYPGGKLYLQYHRVLPNKHKHKDVEWHVRKGRVDYSKHEIEDNCECAGFEVLNHADSVVKPWGYCYARRRDED